MSLAGGTDSLWLDDRGYLMKKRTAIIAAGAALLALPGSAAAAASENASCLGQSASAPAEPGAKGAFVSNVAKNRERGFSDLARGAAQAETC